MSEVRKQYACFHLQITLPAEVWKLRKIKTKEIEVNEHVNERDTATEGDMSDRQTEERREIL
jgi:hypothetical protein